MIQVIKLPFPLFLHRCDSGYHGDTCVPAEALPFNVITDFTHLPDLERDWLAVYGGRIVAANEGCGILLSGESLYFDGVGKYFRFVRKVQLHFSSLDSRISFILLQRGPRELVSIDLYTLLIDYIQFYIRVGGTNSLLCNGATSRESSVLLQYSNNGGISWTLLKELRSREYDSVRLVIKRIHRLKSHNVSCRLSFFSYVSFIISTFLIGVVWELRLVHTSRHRINFNSVR